MNIATIRASLKMFDQFSQVLSRARQGMDGVAEVAERLQQHLQTRISLTVDVSRAVAHIEQVKRQLAASGNTSAMHIVIDADAVTRTLTQIQNRIRGSGVKIIFDTSSIAQDAQQVRDLMIQKLGEIKTKIQIQLPASLTVMFTNIQRLVMRLLVAVRQLSRAGTGSQQLQSALQRIADLESRINQLQQQHNRGLRDGGEAAEGLLGNLKGIAAAYFSIAGIHSAIQFVNWSDEIASTNARLSMMNDGTQTQLELQQKVLAVANGTRQAYNETARMVAQLGASTQGIFKNNKELLDFTSRFNKLLVTGGASAEDSKNAILQMTQSLASGVLQGDELRSLSETAPMLMKVLADGLGVSRGSLKQLGADGKLTSDKVVAAFAKQDAYINKLFSKMPVTFGQVMTLMQNKTVAWVSTLNGADGPMQKLTMSIMAFVTMLDTKQGQGFLDGMTAGIRLAADGIAWFVNFATSHIDTVKNVLIALGTVLTVLAAQWLISWAIAAWPVFAIIGGIALLLTILNKFGISTQQVLAIVAGSFTALFTSIYNQIALIWNILVAFAEFLANVFFDPLYAAQKLFYDLNMAFFDHMYNMARSSEDFAGAFMKSILNAVNKSLESFNWLVDKVNEMFGTDFTKAELFDANNIHAISDTFNKMKDQIEKPISTKNVVDFSAYRMNEKNLSDAFNSGRDYGNNLFAKMSSTLDDIKLKGDAWSNGNINKVNEVGKINDKVDISSQDLKVMRELAEMKNIQNFVTLQPSVNVTTGDINNGYDIDTIIHRIEKSLDEEIKNSVRGVYERG